MNLAVLLHAFWMDACVCVQLSGSGSIQYYLDFLPNNITNHQFASCRLLFYYKTKKINARNDTTVIISWLTPFQYTNISMPPSPMNKNDREYKTNIYIYTANVFASHTHDDSTLVSRGESQIEHERLLV
mmetsp:Transcript_1095/g.1567  ORF Transcript_1095/g.1567 Transcript_1095/m.1567 type:complete len:129 (-) Transcript_1095:417-803(-)